MAWSWRWLKKKQQENELKYENALERHYRIVKEKKSFSYKFNEYLKVQFYKYQTSVINLLNKSILKAKGAKRVLLKFIVLFFTYLLFFTLNSIFLDKVQTKYLWQKFIRAYPNMKDLMK
jgi:hypothetical protein